MDRLACISVPALALQVALRRFPPGYAEALALVAQDRPSSALVHLNRVARDRGLRIGMRYSEALTVVPDLRAVTVSEPELRLAREEIVALLARWSPAVETCPFDPDCFWLGTAGLERLLGDEVQWGTGVRRALELARYRCVVVIGSTRGGTYVGAKTRHRSAIFRSREAEDRVFQGAPATIFPVTVRQRRLLGLLGLRSLASVFQIPAEELTQRLGADLVRPFRLLQSWSTLPLQAQERPPEKVRSRRFDPPILDRQVLTRHLSLLLESVFSELRPRGRLLSEWKLVLTLESGQETEEVLRPASPTGEVPLALRLLALRLESCPLPEPVAGVVLTASDVPTPPGTGELFAPPVVRDLRRGGEALALIRAQWGNQAVVRPVLFDSHIPELSFGWEPIVRLSPPRPSPPVMAAAVRRILRDGSALPGNPAGQRLGSSCRLKVAWGPQVMEREYWFLRNARFEVAWVSRDRLTGGFRWEGIVD